MNKIKLSLLGIIALVLAGNILFAQSVDQGKKFYYYQRYASARAELGKVLADDPANVNAIYWLGQTMIDDNDSLSAKALYQNALNANENAPLLLAGVGHIELLEGKTDDARQHFETAISLSKGKDIAVLNAIGKANAQARAGDANYAIEKLTAATQVKRFNSAETYMYMGDAYRKLIDGGGAVTSYEKALAIDPTLAAAKHSIGRVYLTQNNREIYLPAFEEAVQLDPNYAPALYDLFYDYYNRDINKAAEYFDKYLAVTDPKPSNEYDKISIIYARKAFSDAITAAQQKLSADPNADPRFYKLIAYSYDELKDSVNAKNYLDQYFAKQKEENFVPKDYTFRAQLLSKLGGSEEEINTAFETAIALDTVKANQIEYATTAANISAASKRFQSQIDWMIRLNEIKGDSLSEVDYYNFSKAIADALPGITDTVQLTRLYNLGDSITTAYSAAFSDKSQGYSYRVLIAKRADRDTSKGLALEPMQVQNIFLQTNLTDANRKLIFINYYYMMLYYTERSKSISRAEGYKKAIEIAEQMLLLYPDAASEENKFATQTKTTLQGALDKQKPSQNKTNG